MELDKAIEILSDSANRGVTTFNQDFRHAEKLGIEALKAIRDFRKDWSGNRFNCLPSEDYKQRIPSLGEAFGTTQP